MPALAYVAWFFAGAFLTNAVPHSVAGLQGRKFQSPFAKPPGVGLSSSRTNVLWGLVNLAIGWVLLTQVGDFAIGALPDAAVFGAGIAVMAFVLAGTFGRFHGGND